jgi:hypothetical protein
MWVVKPGDPAARAAFCGKNAPASSVDAAPSKYLRSILDIMVLLSLHYRASFILAAATD